MESLPQDFNCMSSYNNAIRRELHESLLYNLREMFYSLADPVTHRVACNWGSLLSLMRVTREEQQQFVFEDTPPLSVKTYIHVLTYAVLSCDVDVVGDFIRAVSGSVDNAPEKIGEPINISETVETLVDVHLAGVVFNAVGVRRVSGENDDSDLVRCALLNDGGVLTVNTRSGIAPYVRPAKNVTLQMIMQASATTCNSNFVVNHSVRMICGNTFKAAVLGLTRNELLDR